MGKRVAVVRYRRVGSGENVNILKTAWDGAQSMGSGECTGTPCKVSPDWTAVHPTLFMGFCSRAWECPVRNRAGLCSLVQGYYGAERNKNYSHLCMGWLSPWSLVISFLPDVINSSEQVGTQKFSDIFLSWNVNKNYESWRTFRRLPIFLLFLHTKSSLSCAYCPDSLGIFGLGKKRFFSLPDVCHICVRHTLLESIYECYINFLIWALLFYLCFTDKTKV